MYSPMTAKTIPLIIRVASEGEEIPSNKLDVMVLLGMLVVGDVACIRAG